MSEPVVVPVVFDTNVLVPSLYRKTWLQRFILRGNLFLVWNRFIVNEAIKVTDDMWPWYHSHGVKVDPVFVKRLLDRICDPSGCVPEMPDGWPPVSTDRDDDPLLWAAW